MLAWILHQYRTNMNFQIIVETVGGTLLAVLIAGIVLLSGIFGWRWTEDELFEMKIEACHNRHLHEKQVQRCVEDVLDGRRPLHRVIIDREDR